MVWLEQPVGTGFSQGSPTTNNEADVASQFLSFFKNFVDSFAIEGYTVYIVGESYAGYVLRPLVSTPKHRGPFISHRDACCSVRPETLFSPSFVRCLVLANGD